MDLNVANFFLLLGFICGKIECTLLEVNVSSNITSYINGNASIVCSYTVLSSNTEVDSILLQRDDSDNLAKFENKNNKISRYESGSSLKERSEFFNNMSTNRSISLMIKQLHCTEEGIYQFVFTTKDSNTGALHSDQIYSDVVALSVRKPAKMYDVFLVSGTLYEKQESVEVVYRVECGKPLGIIRCWIIRVNKSEQELVTLPCDIASEECGRISNHTLNYNVSETDDGANFRCSVKNDLNDKTLYMESKIIKVYYPVKTPVITRQPLGSSYIVGLPQLSLICSADGNPKPNRNAYKWRFKPENSTFFENIDSVGDVLYINFLSTNDAGQYECLAMNTYGNKVYRSSSAVEIKVQAASLPTKTSRLLSCSDSPCSIVDTCFDQGNTFDCRFNKWAIVGIVFILTTLVFLTASLILFVISRKSKLGVGTSISTHYEEIRRPDAIGSTQQDDERMYAELQRH